MGRRAVAMVLVLALLATGCLDPLVRSGLTWSGVGLPTAGERRPAPVLEVDRAVPGAFLALTHPSLVPGELARVTVTVDGVSMIVPVVPDVDGRGHLPVPVVVGDASGSGRGRIEVRIGHSHPASLEVDPLPPPLDPAPGVVTRAVLGAVDDLLGDALLHLARIEEELEVHPEGAIWLTDGGEERPPLLGTLRALSQATFETSWELLGLIDDLDGFLEGGGPSALDPADLLLLDQLLSAWLVGAVTQLEHREAWPESSLPTSHLPAADAADQVPVQWVTAGTEPGSWTGLATGPLARTSDTPAMPADVLDLLASLDAARVAAPLATILTTGIGLLVTVAAWAPTAAHVPLLVGYLAAVSSFLAVGLVLGGGLAAVEGLLRGEGPGFGDVVADAVGDLAQSMVRLGLGELGRAAALLAVVLDLDDLRRAVRELQQRVGWEHPGHRAQYDADRDRRERQLRIVRAAVHAPTEAHERYGLPADFTYGPDSPFPGRPTTQVAAGMSAALQLEVGGVHLWGSSVTIDWGCPAMPTRRLDLDRSRLLFVSFTVPSSCAGQVLHLRIIARDDHGVARSTTAFVPLEVLHPLELTARLTTSHPTTAEPVGLAVAVRNAITHPRGTENHPEPAVVTATWSGDPLAGEPRADRVSLRSSGDQARFEQTFDRAGRYRVEVSVVDRFGQEAEAALEVEVRDPIEVVGLHGPQQLGVGETGSWTVQVAGGWDPIGIQVAWDDGRGPQLLGTGTTTFAHRLDEARTHWLSVEVTDASGRRAHGALPVEAVRDRVPAPVPSPVEPDVRVERSAASVTGSIRCTRNDGQAWGEPRSWQDYTDTGSYDPANRVLTLELRNGLAPGPANPYARVSVDVQEDGSFFRQQTRSEIAGTLQVDAAGNILGGHGTYAFWYSPLAATVIYECTDHFTITPR